MLREAEPASCGDGDMPAGQRRLPQGSTAKILWIGGAEEDRTPDLLRARQALSQLSYGPGR